ncbi:MAG: tetratricopeptide repeat protein, partial [Proteobacteria bacterium]|nr:tetratricopeptide repeat protein [Pseudomonadota bacterium]
DYRRASEQYGIALQYDLETDERETALFRRALCLRNLAWKTELDGRGRAPDYGRAISAFDTVLAAFPQGEFAREAALIRLTLSLKGTNDVLQVRGAAERFVAQHPEGPEMATGLVLVGDRYAQAGRASAAQDVYRAILQRYRGSTSTGTVMVRLAEGYAAAAKADSALLLLNEFLREYPEHQETARAAFLAARLEQEKGNTRKALERYQQIASDFYYTLYADSVSQRRGDAFFVAGQFAEAANEYQHYLNAVETNIIALSEPEPSVVLNLASCYERIGKTAEAKAAYLQYLAADASTPLKGKVYYALASLVRVEGNSSLAIKYLRQSAESAQDPELREKASLEAADLLFESEEYDGANRQYREVQQLTKNDTLK